MATITTAATSATPAGEQVSNCIPYDLTTFGMVNNNCGHVIKRLNLSVILQRTSNIQFINIESPEIFGTVLIELNDRYSGIGACITQFPMA